MPRRRRATSDLSRGGTEPEPAPAPVEPQPAEPKPEEPVVPETYVPAGSESAAAQKYREWKAQQAAAGKGMPAGQAWPPYPPYPPPPYAPYPAPPYAAYGPQGPYPPPPHGMQPPHGAPPQGAPESTTESLFGSLGSLLRMGIEALNAGLAGGTRLMRGASGHEDWDGEPWGHHGPHHGWQGGCDGCCDCCTQLYDCHQDCSPGVHNCG